MNIELFLCKVNKVTSPHRHGQKISKRALDDLSNAQIDIEASLTQIPTFQYNVSIQSHKDTLELVKILTNDKTELQNQLELANKEIVRLNSLRYGSFNV